MVTFAVLAFVLAAIGLFGVVSDVVSRRRREIGIRIAVGADGARVRALVARQALVLGGAGIGVGLVLSLVLSGSLRAMMFGVEGTDPAVYVGVTLLLLLETWGASALPAWKASRLDPSTALRDALPGRAR